MKKIFFKNRKNQKISVILEEQSNQKGLVFIMHGLGGYKEQPQMEIFAQAFKDNGFTTIRFDTTNTLGESDGDYADATITNYYDDLEDVITWSKSQPWYKEPFILVGHSLGGICTALYAEKYPHLIKALAPLATVVTGKLSYETHDSKELEEWQKTGWLIKPSTSKPGRIKKLKWSHMADRLKYDLLPNVAKLTMPVLMIVGDKDTSCPPNHQQILYDKLPGRKELHVIPGAPHTFKDASHLDQIRIILNNWIQTLN